MNDVMVVDNATGIAILMSLRDAAEATKIQPDEIGRALEAYGVCNSLDHTIIDGIAAQDVAAA